ncbi:MAG: aminoglycoside phosphotransferase [Nocardioides sp.]|nr:aminoglycoside phosphotransferase [Nocardioides sp.]
MGRPDQVREAGATLAGLHDALASYPEADRFPAAAAGTESLAAQVAQWLDSAPAHKPQVACDVLRRLVAAAPAAVLPTQLVHGDYRSANVLCDGSEVVAVIDFEEARFDHRIVELGRSAALLGTQFHHWGPVSSEVRSQFLDGYQSVRALTPNEVAWWPITVLWPSLVMVPQGDDHTGWGSAAIAYAHELE